MNVPAAEPTAAVVVIGNEVLSGKVQDTNSPFLIGALTALGVRVTRVETLPDAFPVIGEALLRLSADVTHVFTTGGIGPTHDDITVPALAAAFGVPLRCDPTLATVVRSWFGDRTTETVLRMALVPEGAELVFGPDLVYPVVKFRNIHVFPGTPGLLRQKFQAIAGRFRAAPFQVVRVYTREEEGDIADHLAAVQQSFPDVLIGSYPEYDSAEYAVLVTAESKDGLRLVSALERILASLRPDAVVRVV